jgi:hypothetical protein
MALVPSPTVIAVPDENRLSPTGAASLVSAAAAVLVAASAGAASVTIATEARAAMPPDATRTRPGATPASMSWLRTRLARSSASLSLSRSPGAAKPWTTTYCRCLISALDTWPSFSSPSLTDA